MIVQGSKKHVVRFGVFEFNTESGELRKRGIKLSLQRKPTQLLQVLLERPGEVLTRDDLRRRLWGTDTFVDFESGLILRLTASA
jgi:DNA-binding winged helix-turn-helix (wHTH) protein